MSSCWKHKAIPSNFWQHKELIEIKYIAPYFPILLGNVRTYVTLYFFDTGADMLLGQDFVKKHFHMLVKEESIEFIVQSKKVWVPAKTEFTMRVSARTPDLVEESLKDLNKIKKLVIHAHLHGQDILANIVKKLK